MNKAKVGVRKTWTEFSFFYFWMAKFSFGFGFSLALRRAVELFPLEANEIWTRFYWAVWISWKPKRGCDFLGVGLLRAGFNFGTLRGYSWGVIIPLPISSLNQRVAGFEPQ